MNNISLPENQTSLKPSLKSKILLLGDSGVGKTCLFNRFFFNTFTLQSVSTQGVIHKVKSYNNYGDTIISLDVWDTAGQERFRSMTKQHYKDTSGIVFIFDLTDLESFKRISLWIREVKNTVSGYMKCLVGNKSDLADIRRVTEEEINNFVEETGFFYLECSAMKNTNVNEIFTFFANETYRNWKNKLIPIDADEEADRLRKIKLGQKYDSMRKFDNSCSC